MADLALAYQARSYSTGVTGRSICNARNHHWVSESPGGEAEPVNDFETVTIAIY